jgi:hypothetical protein
MSSLHLLAGDFADALSWVDADQLAHKQFAPGIGPFGEADAVRAALAKLRSVKPNLYADAIVKRMPDLLIPGKWALEFKIVRPYGDNGGLQTTWQYQFSGVRKALVFGSRR